MRNQAGLYFWLGASADADPALVASDQAAARLDPTGVDPLRCDYCGGDGILDIGQFRAIDCPGCTPDDWQDHCDDPNCDICPRPA